MDPSRRAVTAFALGLASSFIAQAAQPAPFCDYVIHVPSMGTVFEVQYVDSCAASATTKKTERALKLKGLLEPMEASMSLYQSQSDLSRLNREGELADPPADFKRVVALALEHGARTEGYFDVTIWPVLSLIKAAFRATGREPALVAIDALRDLVDYRQVELALGRIRFRRQGMALTLDGIAKGYAVDRVAEMLEREGLRDFVANFSGNMRVRGRRADGKRWSVAAHDPTVGMARAVQLEDSAIASSGTESASYSKDGRWHHLIDPKTLRPAWKMEVATIAGPSAAVCDILSTATFVMGIETAKRIMQKHYPQYRYRFVDSAHRVHGSL